MSFYKVWASRKPKGSAANFVAEKGELFYDDDDNRLRMGDGVTPGGVPVTTDTNIDLSALVQNVVPAQDATNDLGANGKSWQTLYLSDQGLYVGDKQILIDGNNNLVLPEGTQVRTADGELLPVGSEIDVSQLNLQIYLNDLQDVYAPNPAEGSILQRQNNQWAATNNVTTSSGELVIAGEIY